MIRNSLWLHDPCREVKRKVEAWRQRSAISRAAREQERCHQLFEKAALHRYKTNIHHKTARHGKWDGTNKENMFSLNAPYWGTIDFSPKWANSLTKTRVKTRSVDIPVVYGSKSVQKSMKSKRKISRTQQNSLQIKIPFTSHFNKVACFALISYAHSEQVFNETKCALEGNKQ